MAPHVSRFVTRLFDVDTPAAAIAALDARPGRPVPLQGRLRPPPRAAAAEGRRARRGLDAEDDAVVERADRGRVARSDRELAVARAGCALLDREKSRQPRDPQSAQPADRGAEALVRGARSTIRAYRDWVDLPVSRRTLDPGTSSRSSAPIRSCRRRWSVPDWRLRRRDGFTLTDARMQPREVLSEIHYCVLCHERDKDSCSKGLHDKDGAVTVNPLGIALDGCPLDEKISEMHTLRKARRCDRRARAGHRSTTRCARAPATASATTA